MIHERAGLHLGDILRRIKTRVKTGMEIRSVEGVPLLLGTGVRRVKFQCVCRGGACGEAGGCHHRGRG